MNCKNIDIIDLVSTNNRLLEIKEAYNEVGLEFQRKIIKYYMEIQKKCSHNIFFNRGYYCKIYGNIIICNKEQAHFRIVECQECNEIIFLLKNKYDDWDTTYGNMLINVIDNCQIGFNKTK